MVVAVISSSCDIKLKNVGGREAIYNELQNLANREFNMNWGMMFRLRGRILFIIGLVLIGTIGLAWLLNRNPVYGWDFRNNLWIPTKLLINGQSPYRVNILNEKGNAIWLPMIIGALFPLGMLSYAAASNIWFIFNLTALLASTFLTIRWNKPSMFLVVVSAIVVAAFPPTLTHFKLGQITILATSIYLTVGIFKSRIPIVITTLILAVALSKPQLGILIVPGLLIAYYREDGLISVLKLFGLLILWIAFLTVPLFAGHNSWFHDFIEAFSANPNWLHPSMWTLLPYKMGPAGLWLAIVIALVLFIINIWLWLTRNRVVALLWSLALTPLITPYVWSWDFVMVMPLFVYSLTHSKNISQYAYFGAGYLLCWILVMWITTSKDNNNVLYWWIPWLMLLVVVVSRTFYLGTDRKIWEPQNSDILWKRSNWNSPKFKRACQMKRAANAHTVITGWKRWTYPPSWGRKGQKQLCLGDAKRSQLGLVRGHSCLVTGRSSTCGQGR